MQPQEGAPAGQQRTPGFVRGPEEGRASQVAVVVKNPPAHARDLRDLGFIAGWGRSPGGGHKQHTLVFLPGESYEERSLAGYRSQGGKELDTTEET